MSHQFEFEKVYQKTIREEEAYYHEFLVYSNCLDQKKIFIISVQSTLHD